MKKGQKAPDGSGANASGAARPLRLKASTLRTPEIAFHIPPYANPAGDILREQMAQELWIELAKAIPNEALPQTDEAC
jgi:hypothetical protein